MNFPLSLRKRLGARPHGRIRAHIIAASLALLACMGSLTAHAAPPDQTPLITNNLQGASSQGEALSKWSTSVQNFIRSAQIVLLQEVGGGPPPGSVEVERIPFEIGPFLPNVNWGQILHHRWRPGSSSRDPEYHVYFLQTDANGGRWTGGRVNLAIVTHRPADEVRVVRNPAGGRHALGVRFGTDWYFTLHAQSQTGADAAPLVDAIDDAVAAWGNNSHDWTVAGDFNTDPARLRQSPDLPPAHIYNSGQATQRSGGELDYAVSSHALGSDYPVHRLRGATPDHFAVSIGGIRGAADIKLGAYGDSITHGIKSSTGNGYRAALYAMLLAGISIGSLAKRSVDFVGTQSSGSMADPQHDGYPGFTISQIASELAVSVPLHRPNVVTLHAGTNDMKTDRDAVGAPERLGALIDQILRDSSGVAVLVATLVPSTDPAIQARITAFNRALPQIVAVRRDRGAHVALVDMSAVTLADLGDALHPNDAGYAKMANAFAGAVTQAIVDGWIVDPSEPAAHCTDAGRWLPQGQIASGTGTNTSSPSSPRVVFADLNGDGRDDYLTVEPGTGVTSAWLNNGGDRPGVPGWLPRGVVATGTGLSGAIYFADLNGDRRDDYLVVDPQSGAASAWINGGEHPSDGRSWIWHPKGRVAAGTGVPGAIRFADVNGDARDDYLIVNIQTGAVNAWLNGGGDLRQGSGWNWQAAGQIASGLSPAASVAFADADGDGRDDYLVVDARTGAVDAWLNRGGDRPGVPGWAPRGRIAAGVGVSGAMVSFADVNADGRDDYLALDNLGTVRAWLNNCGDPP